MANFQEICKKIRRQIIESSYRVGACHIGSALSCVEILVILYWKILKKNDIFIFSKASGASALYSVLAERGYFKKEKLDYYLKNYPLASREVPGVMVSVGSLGHGLPIATGMALANRKRKVYCLISDAELDEGTTWESALFANHHHLDNLIIIVDRNFIQACGKTEEILNLEPLREKFHAFGWTYVEFNGHDLITLENRLKMVNEQRGFPIVIIADTIKGKGITRFEDDYTWHYKNIDGIIFQEALKELE